MRIRTQSLDLVTSWRSNVFALTPPAMNGMKKKHHLSSNGEYIYTLPVQTPDSAPQPTRISMYCTVAVQHVEIRVMKICRKAAGDYHDRLVMKLRGTPVGNVLQKYKFIGINFK